MRTSTVIALFGVVVGCGQLRERRREIGTLMAIGATLGFVLRLFLMKAMILGVVAVRLAACWGS